VQRDKLIHDKEMAIRNRDNHIIDQAKTLQEREKALYEKDALIVQA
jgi:hypothetical protein